MIKFYQKFFFGGLLLAVLLSGCADGNRTDTAISSAQGSVDTSSQIVFEGRDINGNIVTSTIFSEARLTMVNVWATYCNPCLNEMPGLGELAGSYEKEDFQIIGIISDVQENSDEATFNQAKALIEETSADYPHLLLNESIYYSLLTDVTAVPTTFFVNEAGTVIDIVVGAMDKDAWEDKINEILENN